MTRRAPRQWQSPGGLARARITVGMSLLGHQPVNVVNSVCLFRSMTGAWSSYVPASVHITLVRFLDVRGWTWAVSLDTGCGCLSSKFHSRISMDIYQLTHENNIPSHNDHQASFFPTFFFPTGLALVVAASTASTSSVRTPTPNLRYSWRTSGAY
ncbi:hypothetical protein H4582DRAFT_2002549 [Lactarius indigo]|nr:hypothetical protein H4582DRAFT_2002549 [Lactarius indigo]